MGNQTAWFSPTHLVRLLTEQRDVYNQLESLSHRQRTMISGDRPEALLNILSERQKLVQQLAQLNNQLAPFRRDWDALFDQLPDPVRAQVGELLDQINAMLRSILRSDQEDSALLSARKQSVAQSLERFSGGAAAHNAYSRGNSAGSSPGSADLSG